MLILTSGSGAVTVAVCVALSGTRPRSSVAELRLASAFAAAWPGALATPHTASAAHRCCRCSTFTSPTSDVTSAPDCADRLPSACSCPCAAADSSSANAEPSSLVNRATTRCQFDQGVIHGGGRIYSASGCTHVSQRAATLAPNLSSSAASGPLPLAWSLSQVRKEVVSCCLRSATAAFRASGDDAAEARSSCARACVVCRKTADSQALRI